MPKKKSGRKKGVSSGFNATVMKQTNIYQGEPEGSPELYFWIPVWAAESFRDDGFCGQVPVITIQDDMKIAGFVERRDYVLRNYDRYWKLITNERPTGENSNMPAVKVLIIGERDKDKERDKDMEFGVWLGPGVLR